MENRQQQIQTGAGLTESQLNTEFIDALKRFGPYLIMLIALGVLAYVGYGRLKQAREARTLDAFRGLNEALVSNNPDNLVRFADEQADRPALAAQALWNAADTWMLSVAQGTRPGAVAGAAPAPDDVLDAATSAALLDKAKAQYERVLEIAGQNEDLWLARLRGHFGLAAVAESRADLAEAKRQYQAARELAEKLHLTGLTQVVDERLNTMSDLANVQDLISEKDVMSIPYDGPPIPVLPEEDQFAGASAVPAASTPEPATIAPVTPATAPAAPPAGMP